MRELPRRGRPRLVESAATEPRRNRASGRIVLGLTKRIAPPRNAVVRSSARAAAVADRRLPSHAEIGGLSERFLNRLARDDGGTFGTAVVQESDVLVVQAEGMQDRGVNIGDV